MKNTTKYLILGSAILLIVVLLFYFMSASDPANNSGLDENGDPITDTTQVKKPINPTGTYLLYNLLKKYEKTRTIQTIQTTEEIELDEILPIESKNESPNLYISISEEFFLYSMDGEHLLEFVEDGNYALVAAKSFTSSMCAELFKTGSIVDKTHYDTALFVNFTHPDLAGNQPLKIVSEDVNFHGRSKFKEWTFFDSLKRNDDQVILSYSDRKTNCILLQYGDGFFIFHSQPGNFSNINIARTDGKTNVENILSHFPVNNIYWHQNFGKYSEYRGVTKPKNNDKLPPKEFSRSSPLQYILKNPALSAAFMILLAGITLYMVVYSKRQQKVIPPIPDNKNSSLEFVNVVSKLYFQQKQHNKLINHKIQIFIAFIRDRYYINLAQKDPEVIQKIADKSGIEIEKIKKILNLFKEAKSKKFSDQELINLHMELEYFYKHCK